MQGNELLICMQRLFDKCRRHTNLLCANGEDLSSGLLLATQWGLCRPCSIHTLTVFKHDGTCNIGTCYNGECEGLHVPAEERAEQASWPKPLHQKVIITAGVSTGLFGKLNAQLALQPRINLDLCTFICIATTNYSLLRGTSACR